MLLSLPAIFLLPVHLEPDELHSLESRIPTLTYNIDEAEIVLGNVSREQRARFELRRLRIETEPLRSRPQSEAGALKDHDTEERAAKRRKPNYEEEPDNSHDLKRDIVRVVNVSWLRDSLEKDKALPMEPYVVYEGRKLGGQELEFYGKLATAKSLKNTTHTSTTSILERSANDKEELARTDGPSHRTTERIPEQSISTSPRSRKVARPDFARQSTSEDDVNLPTVPDFLHTTYSCQRPTPVTPPNSAFIEELKSVRTLRLLWGDKVGVRAYSTSISSVAAYPHLIHSPNEISRLPGCSTKIAELYQEWQRNGYTNEVRNSEADQKAIVLRKFYNIWGVGDIGARDFYQRGWRDFDDIVEYGWQSLTRVQQIGVKYYDEFQQKIAREEVAQIGRAVLEQARQLDPGYEMMIVGGYRRGKAESSDVDVMISHREEGKTLKLIGKLVLRLEATNYITHTLTLSLKNSERAQAPLPWKGDGTTWSTGFDTLDKAMVVWQDPAKPDALHRRVDIIVSPWKTIGCAVLGWSGETTFQRDLRRYCKQELGLKFDSSGIRNRSDGSWVDYEGTPSPSKSMEEAERRVFEGLGITWRPPSERCTG